MVWSEPTLAADLNAVAPQEGAEGERVIEVPFMDEWMGSPHNNVEGEAFRHWDEDDPAEVPASCAKCHSTPGYVDFLGADGSEAGVVDQAAPLGSTVECVACHNDVTLTKDSVVMPSGIELTGLGDESRCMECHQGRQSKVSVDAAIETAGVEEDVVSPDLGFLNIHYYAAAASKYGTLAKGGYEYDGLTYDGNFMHVEEYDTCIECHDSHTLELDIEGCAECHDGAASVEDIRNVRMAGSVKDYDGDGDVEEGVYFELAGLQELLYGAIQAYASEVAGTAIAYDSQSHPYFFIDTDGSGVAEEAEVNGDNRFASWTPRLLKAAYNYQTSIKDPGAYVHGGKYHIQLLHDSIASLNEAIGEPVDMSAASRIDAGHFAGSEEAFRHWDEDGAVPGNCAKCHTDSGLPTFLAEGVNVSVAPPSNGFMCTTCHDNLDEYTRYPVESVKFPSGAVLDFGVIDDDEEARNDTNLCMNCHQGRESTVSVNRAIGDTEADTVSDSLSFRNVHYFAAGATRWGTEAKGAYEYEGKEYVGFFDHSNLNACTDCHGAHSLEVELDTCLECHEDIESVQDIRYDYADYDGNGDDEEGIAIEVASLTEMLYAALQDYAANTVGTPIVYNSHAYPYFFIDANADGVADEGDTERYVTWTPRLLRAAYNYQYASKDPGSFVHNGKYIIQTLQDSLEDLGGDVSAMVRPEVE
jgi:hypothetical protein